MNTSSKTGTLTNILLVCGIAATLLYIIAVTFVAMQYPGYNYMDQAISELSAIGAPTATLWALITLPYNPLMIACGIGIWRAAGSKKSLKIAGIVMAVSAVIGLAWFFFPMNQRGAIGSFSDTMHLVMSGLTGIEWTLLIAFGSLAAGKKFFVYSMLTIIVMLGFGSLVGFQAPDVAAQLPTPWMGIWERVSVFAPMVWILVLAIVKLRALNTQPRQAAENVSTGNISQYKLAA